jgi:hypothetical protein
LSGATGPVPSKADTFLISCIDPRLADDTTFRFEALGRTNRYSEMRIAGAALAIVDNRNPGWQATLWENLAATREMHGIRNVTLLNHRDCGAMNAWAGRRLADDPTDELRVHTEVLNAAADAIRARHPDLLIEIKLMDLGGHVERPVCRNCVPAGFRLGPIGTDGIPMLEPAETAPASTGEARFTELARLRNRAGPMQTEAELALLSTGVTEAGLTATQARQALDAARGAQPSATNVERDVVTYLRSRMDREGQVGPTEMQEAARLYRRLQGGGVTPREADAQAARIAQGAGLRPRPHGFWPFRSTRWFGALLSST